jgi:hypothetical protein
LAWAKSRPNDLVVWLRLLLGIVFGLGILGAVQLLALLSRS